VHAVIHCVQFPGHPIENPEKRWTFQEVDVRGTRNMLEACGRAGVRRFVYLSAAGSSVHPLYQAKCSAEEAIRRSELEWVVLRPDWVYGPGDRGLVRLATRLRWLPVVPVPGRDEIRARPVAVHDVARAAVLSISRREAAGRAFDIGGPEEFSLIEILRVVLRVMGKRRALVQVPFRAARLAAGLVSMIPGARISPSVLDLLLLREPGNPLIAEQALGFRCLDLETGLREYLGVVKK
jgi:NADH dehydrogenase